ncbi:MAG: hypothetical protein JSV56_07100 [Methanomassiliicoccales archaeon]|nr:MAG: hypothetical protein JSV56_07100 [Methanomassiliicoccales archaeon]
MNDSDTTEHLEKMKKAGVNWIRMDVKKPINKCEHLFKEAHEMGLYVIAAVNSKEMLKGKGFFCEKYFSSCDWKEEWKIRIEEAARKLSPYIDIWQIDNELNHPWHNPIPWINSQLALDIVEVGVDALKKENPKAKTSVNVFYRLGGPLDIPGLYFIRDTPIILKYKEKLKNKIDILGMDIYRGTWHGGTPARYPYDLERYHDLWEGDVIIMETGYCTGILGRSEARQAHHVKQVFQALDNHIKNVDWFLGIVWYVFESDHSGIPCEEHFGLHRREDFHEKKAWEKFAENVKRYNRYDKVLGITYHG